MGASISEVGVLEERVKYLIHQFKMLMKQIMKGNQCHGSAELMNDVKCSCNYSSRYAETACIASFCPRQHASYASDSDQKQKIA
jgi:hypothetical protein